MAFPDAGKGLFRCKPSFASFATFASWKPHTFGVLFNEKLK